MIVYCCSDLIFATKIRSTAEALGLVLRPGRTAEAMKNRLEQVDDGKPNEPITGVLIDLELADQAMALIEQVKHHDQNIPVIAFGSHVATTILDGAKQHGADFVMARSAFTANLPDILRRFGKAEA